MAFIDSISITTPADTDDPGDFPAENRADKAALLNTFPNIDGEVTATEDDLNTTDVATLGTAEASKVVTADANIDVTGIRNLTMTGTLADATLTGATLTSPVLNGTLSGTAFLDEDTMSSDSAIAAASQQSIKAYVDAAVAAAGTVLQVQFATTFSNVASTTSWQTRDDVTLTGVQSGSSVVLIALAKFNKVGSGTTVSLDLTDSGNTSLMSDSEAMAADVTNAAFVTIPIMAQDSSPGTGTVAYNLRQKASANSSAEVAYTAIVALEVGA